MRRLLCCSFVGVVGAVVVTAGCPGAAEGEGESGEGEGEGDSAEGEGDVVGEGEGEVEVVSPRFVAVGYGGRRLTSRDGRVWEHDVEDVENGGDDDNLFRGACFGVVDGESVLLAVGGSAVGRVARSVDGGETWTQIVDDEGWIGGCAFDADLGFVFVGSARSARSVDGGRSLIDRNTHFLGGRGSWEMRDVIASGGRFVAVGDTGVSVSDDGVVWPDPTGPSDLSRVAVGSVDGGERFVAVGLSKRATSSNATDWSEVGEGGSDVVFGGGRFLVVGEGFRFTSTDGVTFVRGNQPAMGRVTFGVVDGQDTWLGANFTDVRRLSVDGETWSDVANDGGNALEDLLFIP